MAAPPADAAIPQEQAILGIAPTPRSDQVASASDQRAAVDAVRQAGGQGLVRTAPWSAIEDDLSVVDLITGDTNGGFSVVVGVHIIDGLSKSVPNDLAALAFDDPQLRARFHTLLDRLVPRLPASVRTLSLSRDADRYLGAHPNERAAFQALVSDAVAYAHSLRADLKIGAGVSFAGVDTVTFPSADVVITSYAPHGPRYAPPPAAAIPGDLDHLVASAAGRSLVLLDVACPSAESLNSSEQQQSDFVAAFAAAWRARAAQIPFAAFAQLHDADLNTCQRQASADGLANDTYLIPYLCSLGLWQSTNTPKQAWSSFHAAVH